MFTLKGHHRTAGRKARPVSVETKRSDGAHTGKLPLAVAAAAAAYVSAGMLAAPAQAATTTDGWSETLTVPVAVPYSEDEIRGLQQAGDLLGANSRMMANAFAEGRVYRS